MIVIVITGKLALHPHTCKQPIEVKIHCLPPHKDADGVVDEIAQHPKQYWPLPATLVAISTVEDTDLGGEL